MVSQMDSVARTAEDRLTKICTVCGGTIVWQRWLDRSWHELKYCGAVCRRKALAMKRTEVDKSIVSSQAV